MDKYPLFKIHKTGLLTTFQDLGRTGFQQSGVPVSGAMDTFSFQVANLLVGNKRAEAVLEITIMGPEMEVLSPISIAVCGGNLQMRINEKKVPMWQLIQVQKSDIITFGIRKSGLRAYLSVAGGFDIVEAMGSKSRYDLAGLGAEIKKNAIIYGQTLTCESIFRVDKMDVPTYKKSTTLRVIKGPHQEWFTQEGIDIFYNEAHQVTTQFNRMAYRFKSTPISHIGKGDMWSEAVPFGAVQVPENGQPILLMADRQTTGGYPVIATVISVDLPKAAQLAPGDEVHFKEVGIEEAQSLYKKQEHFFEKW